MPSRHDLGGDHQDHPAISPKPSDDHLPNDPDPKPLTSRNRPKSELRIEGKFQGVKLSKDHMKEEVI